MMQTQVLIIGAGATGTGLARDLALRGIHSLVVDRGHFNSGASGANHGLLHSGARYVQTDPDSARECREESALLKKLAPQCIEDTGGLFLATEVDGEDYIAQFPDLCSACGIEAEELSPEKAREQETVLSDRIRAAYYVPDAVVEPFRLSLDNLGQALELGAGFWPFTEVKGFERDNGEICRVHLHIVSNGQYRTVQPQMVVNAAGAWSGKVAGLAGTPFDMLYSQGTLAVTDSRITRKVINRLRYPGDGDILVPGGHVSILGTTSVNLSHPDAAAPTVKEVDTLLREGSTMLPTLEKARFIRAYAGVRPIYAGRGVAGGERSAGRSFVLLDHREEGVENLLSLTGGKLTTFRLMAQKCADMICSRLDLSADCRTHLEPLPRSRDGKWLEQGREPRGGRTASPLLCECEMVPQSVFAELAGSLSGKESGLNLTEIRLRTRMGKGPCQGTFCSLRVPKHAFGPEDKAKQAGKIRKFLQERWKGVRPVLWGTQLSQAELANSMHSGFFSLEMPENRVLR